MATNRTQTEKLKTWAEEQLKAVRGLSRFDYSTRDSLSDYLSEGPFSLPEISALEAACLARPENFDRSCLDLFDNVRPASEDERAAHFRETYPEDQ